MSATSNRLADWVGRFGDGALALGEPLDVWGQGATAVVRPADRAALVELLTFARSEGLRLLPLGRGTKLGRRLPPARLDLLVDMGAFNRVLAFEPGDGTLTAEGGASLDELVALCRGGARTIVPELLPGASLGGAIATAETGCDRLARGPIREHVLGLEVLLSDGTTSKSGGRLVKNVAGYDLHRLHTGAWGGLGFILEATLRLFPAPERECSLVTVCSSLADAIELATSLRAARLPAKRIWCRLTSRESLLIVCLAGRGDVVGASIAMAQRLVPGLTPSVGIPPELRPHWIMHSPPSAAAELAAHTQALLAQLPQDTVASVDPLLARSALATEGLGALELTARLEPLAQLAQASGIQLALPKRPAPGPHGSSALTRGIELALDPSETLAR